MFTLGVLTVSDKSSRGERTDESGKACREVLAALDVRLVKYDIVPDERKVVSQRLREWADEEGIDLIVTTGGTGLAPRDVTPEATLEVIDRLAPGFAEVMRAESLNKTSYAMLSRGVAGTRNRTLIINLPGSPKAVRECLQAILPVLPHAVEVLRGGVVECGENEKG